MEEEHKKKINELKERIGGPALSINEIPKKELDWFREWCKEEFSDNRGMGLKELIRVYHEYYEMRDTYIAALATGLDAYSTCSSIMLSTSFLISSMFHIS